MTKRRTKLNLGLIGTGWPGQQHALALAQIEHAKLFAAADLDATRRSAFEKEFAPEKSYGDYAQLLKDPHVDAAIIWLPNFLHFPASLAAIDTGTHALCKKPLFFKQKTAYEMRV